MLGNAREIYLIEFKRIFQNWLKEKEKNKLIIRIARNSRDQKMLAVQPKDMDEIKH